jgi:hypothetical protein
MIRMGHIGTTVLDASLSEGSVSAFWSIDAQDVCVADITRDGALNFNDISAFLTAYVDRDPIADLTGEGDYNFADVSQFLLEYGMGCPE